MMTTATADSAEAGFLHRLLALGASHGVSTVRLVPDKAPEVCVRGDWRPVSPQKLLPSHVLRLLTAFRNLANEPDRGDFFCSALALDPFAVTVTGTGEALQLRIDLAPPTAQHEGVLRLLGDVLQAPNGVVWVGGLRSEWRRATVLALARYRKANAARAALLLNEVEDAKDVERVLALAAQDLCLVPAAGSSVREMLERMAGWFVGDDRQRTMGAAAKSLGAAVAVVLVPSQQPAGKLIAAADVLLPTSVAVQKLMEGDWDGVVDEMRAGRERGMQTIDQHLFELYDSDAVSYEDALRFSVVPNHLRLDIKLRSRRARSMDLAAGVEHLDILSPRVEPLQFRAFLPARVARGQLLLVDIWACLPKQVGDVVRLASGGVQAGLRAGVPVTRGSTVTVRLRVDGMKVRAPVQSLAWLGEPANVAFIVEVPADAAPSAFAARALLSSAGVPIGEIAFQVVVAAETADPEPPRDVTASMFRSAFASYASEDRAGVLARIQGMRKIAPECDVFVDALTLRSGDRWQQRIEREVVARDKLFLFWSRNASASRWVDFEWRLAHRVKGLGAIDPVPLDDPRQAPPPPELAELHFGDAYLAAIAYEPTRAPGIV